MVIYGKKPSKIENKQQNLRISTNHKYRIYMYMDVFLQPDILKTWHFVNLTFCKADVFKPNVSDVLKPDALKPDVLKPDVLWVYQNDIRQNQ